MPFGLRSAPKIFAAVADTLEWCLRQRGVELIHHYLDDFIVISPPSSDQCQNSLNLLDEVCSTLHVPLATQKREGLTTCLTFLGIEMNSVDSTLKLPEEKLEHLVGELQWWGDRKVCSGKELKSLVGLLNHALSIGGHFETGPSLH